MGTWGTGPFDNDDAADFVAKLSRDCERALKSSYHYNAARVAATVMAAAHGTDILGGPPIDNALKALERMRVDEEWLAGWRRPREIRDALDKQIRQVRAIMRRCRFCRKLLVNREKPVPPPTSRVRAVRRLARAKTTKAKAEKKR